MILSVFHSVAALPRCGDRVSAVYWAFVQLHGYGLGNIEQ
jgi:hypothetical protein